MKKTRALGLLAATAVAALIVAAPTRAAGPLALFDTGQPYLWPAGGTNIPINPDLGPFGLLTNAQAVTQTMAALQEWQNVPTATVTHVNAGSLPLNVDTTNFFPWIFPAAPDGLNAVIYDEDGSLFALLFGPGSGVLGFAGPEWVSTVSPDIIEGSAFFNGGAMFAGFPIPEILSLEVHEFGHYQNLGHSAVNGQVVIGDTSGPTPNNTFGLPNLFERVETMYPFLFIGGGQATVHPDDVASISQLYPEPTFASSTASITGTIFAPNGTTKVSGVNVIARNIANPFDDAVSALSGDFTDDFAQTNALAGVYTLNGLTPGASYAVFIDHILAGGFSTPPLGIFPGLDLEEFHNGAGEAATGDDPAVFTAVSAGAGMQASGIDVIINTPVPGDPLPLGDDTSIEIALPFPYEFCGTRYDSVFVNANGHLTFGAGDADFRESAADHLGGLPRIAGLWDDLNPQAGGTVFFTQTNYRFTVHFETVPEFGIPTAVGSNSFRIQLKDNNEIRLFYDGLTATDGLAGFSCGGQVTNALEPEIDISSFPPQTVSARKETAAYEVFDSGELDLDGLMVRIKPPRKRFRDRDELNNDIGQAGRVFLPFNSADRFTTVRDECLARLPANTVLDDDSDDDSDDDNDPDMGPGACDVALDVDYFIFDAQAGTTLIAETVPGNSLDTIIGLFSVPEAFASTLTSGSSGVEVGSTPVAAPTRGRLALAGTGRFGRATRAQIGRLLAVDDDGGVGLLSRLTFPITQSGTFAIAVGTFPDSRFIGAGNSSGRYVLDLQTVNGFLLDLGDDDSQSVPLGFAFPFQGSLWTDVFVNSNGNLTFGAGDNDFRESVSDLLAGPPRIAPLWDDLSPNAGGQVIVETGGTSATISFVGVPEFGTGNSNTFAVTLDATGEVTILYGGVDAADGLVGVSEGGLATDPGPTDLSAGAPLTATGTTYEVFAFAGPFDLAGGILLFTP